MSFNRKKRPPWIPGGDWVEDGDKWVWVKKGHLAEYDAEHLGRHYESPEFLQDETKPKPAVDPQIGRYHSPHFLNNPPSGPSQGPSAPVISPTTLPAGNPKPDTAPKREMAAIKTCSLCHGILQDGLCTKCSSKQCPGCGDMNFAGSKSCFRCGHPL